MFQELSIFSIIEVLFAAENYKPIKNTRFSCKKKGAYRIRPDARKRKIKNAENI